MVRKHIVETSDELFRRSRAESEQDDPGMRLSLANNELSEISVIGDDNSVLSNSDGKDVDVSEGSRVVLTDGRNIMPQSTKEGCKVVIRALVKQKSPTYRLGDTCLRPTIMRRHVAADVEHAPQRRQGPP